MFNKLFGIIAVFLVIFPFSIPFMSAEEDKDTSGWWEHWCRDKNHNGIDDLIDEKIASNSKEEIAIFVDYDCHPTEKDIHRLLNLGLDISYYCKYINTICIENVTISKIQLISKLPNIVMIEQQLPMSLLLDTSTRTVKARPSELYHDVWEELGFTGEGINIAILDTGVDDDHESLQGKFVAGVDFTQPDTPATPRDGSYNPDDRNGHGTRCAGIAMGTGGAEGTYRGVAPDANLIDVKMMSDVGINAGTTVEAIEWCVEHKDDFDIDILSMSVTQASGTSDGQDAVSRSVNDAVADGLVVVAGIGNNGPDNDGIGAPAAADKAISVGNLNNHNSVNRTDDDIDETSSRGPREDDGDNDPYDELKPEVSAPGENTMSSRYSETGQSGNEYAPISGSSAACPHVAGIAALMLQANPKLKPTENSNPIKIILQDTAEARGEPYDENLSKKYNTSYGFGMVDAYQAVLFAIGGENQTKITCKIDYPKEGEIISGNIEITGTASVNIGEIEYIEVKIENDDWKEASGTNNWSYKWNTKSVSDGDYIIYARAFDGSNYSESFSVNVSVKNQNENLKPKAFIDSIEPNPAIEGEEVTFKGHGEDDDGSIVEYFWESNLNEFLSSNSLFILSNLSVGTHKISLKVKDNSELWSEEITETLTINSKEEEEILPDLSIFESDITFSNNNPKTGEIIQISALIHNTGDTKIRATVEFWDGNPENGILIDSVEILIDAKNSETVSISWEVTNGEHSIYVKITNSNKQEKEISNNLASKIITVEEIEEQSDDDFPVQWVALSIGIVAVSVIGIAVFQRKRNMDYWEIEEYED